MNNCRKFIDKAPLVKRLSNSLLRSGDEYRPLLNDNNFSSVSNYLSASTAQIASKIDNITDDTLCDANEMIASKFGDSCRKSLTSVLLDNRRTKDYCEFDFKQNFLRETSSGECFFFYFFFLLCSSFLLLGLKLVSLIMFFHCIIHCHTYKWLLIKNQFTFKSHDFLSLFFFLYICCCCCRDRPIVHVSMMHIFYFP